MYDDFKILASDYDFLKDDSYVGCHKTYTFGKELIINKLGTLNHKDMLKILDKIRNSNTIPKSEKEALVFEIEHWLEDYQKNKLASAFKR
jgi:hypothetical protein